MKRLTWTFGSVLGAVIIVAVGTVISTGAQGSPNTLQSLIANDGGVPPTTVPPVSTNIVQPDLGGLTPNPLAATPLVHSSVPVPILTGTTCTGSEVNAALTSNGPYIGMGSDQLIVSLSSSTSCTLSGYPVLSLYDSNGAGAGTKFIDGGTIGSPQSTNAIQLGPNNVGSFLIQFSGNASCVPANIFQLSLSATSSPVVISNDSSLLSSWPGCSVMNETPFVEGNSVGVFA